MARSRMPAPIAHVSQTLKDPATARVVLLTLLTGVFGVVSVACASRDEWHVPGSWAGVAGLLTGALAQLLSASTAQRWVTVVGWGLAFVGTMLNMAHGGLW